MRNLIKTTMIAMILLWSGNVLAQRIETEAIIISNDLTVVGNIYLNGVGITTNLDVILNDNTNNQVLVTVVSGSNTNLVWTNSPTFKSLTVSEGINLGGTSLSTNLTAITNDATDGTYLYVSVVGGVTNISWQPMPQANTPYPIVSAASSDVSQVWNYQKLIVTNSPCTLYWQGVSVVGSNRGRTVWLDVDKGTNSFTFANANCATSGLGSVTNLIATNSGVSSFMFVLPTAGTNLNVVWRGYQLL